MATLTLQGTGVTDTHIQNGAQAGNNYSTNTISFFGNSGGSIYRAIFKFDLSSIPAGSTISSAVLTLKYAQDLANTTGVVNVFRILQPVVIAEATWNVYSTGNSWATAGCGNTTSDRESTEISDTPTIPASPTIDTTVDITLTASKVQEMITGGGFTNNGFLIKTASESADDLIGYYFTDHATSTNRPKLVVTYTEGGGNFLPLL